jgi:hypothetical protein
MLSETYLYKNAWGVKEEGNEELSGVVVKAEEVVNGLALDMEIVNDVYNWHGHFSSQRAALEEEEEVVVFACGMVDLDILKYAAQELQVNIVLKAGSLYESLETEYGRTWVVEVGPEDEEGGVVEANEEANVLHRVHAKICAKYIFEMVNGVLANVQYQLVHV